jgi:serine/threonine-protein kinase HipA
MTDRSLLVYVDLKGAPHFVGRLWARSRKGKEGATFEYDAAWITNPLRFALEPALTLGAGPHHTASGRSIFGAIGDSAPDRWGRMLIQREERRKAREEKRAPRTLLEVDYLLDVSDIARQGALRFAEQEGGPFLAAGTDIPPLIQMPALLGAAMRLSEDDGGSDDDLRLLLAPGSSLGGARPKASVLDHGGQLAIAKFPQPGDQTCVTLWEAVALTLAKKAGIPTPEWRTESVVGRNLLVLSRFDRSANARIPFLSAMSLLNGVDNEPHSYMEIADALRQYGAKADEDCAQLWRRIVFNILISNTDDHLRNHGFLYEANGWRLSPAYDLNPVPVDIKPRILTTAIDEADGTASLDIAYEVAGHFGVKANKAKAITREVGAAVAGWREVAAATGLTGKEIERVASAFEHEELQKAIGKSP